MEPNATITIYHKTYDAATRMDVYTRSVMSGVYLFETKAVNVANSGLSDADSIVLHAPVNTEVEVGDTIVLTESTADINNTYTLSKLRSNYRCVTVTKVDYKRYGSKRLQHVEIGCA